MAGTVFLRPKTRRWSLPMLPLPTADRPTGLQPAAAPAAAPELWRYRVAAVLEPSVLPRVLELFTLRDLLPTEVNCRQVMTAEPELRIDVAVTGLDAQHAEHLAQRMRTMMPVTSVLLQRSAG